MHPTLIVGAGIGGLVAATALARRGHEVHIVERAPEITAVGAGIILGANATAILAALGIPVEDEGRALTALDVLAASGRVVQPLAVGEVPGLAGRILAFHRGELHAALLGALPSDVELRLGTTVADLQDHGSEVRARFSNGSAETYSLVVGADGLRSETRKRLHGDLPLRYAGETCWRAVVPGCADLGADCAEVWGDGVRMGVVPLTGGRAYVFLVQVAQAGGGAVPWPTLRARFDALGGPCPRVLARMDDAPLLHHDLYELDAPVWGSGRIWLLGDAAHGMTPNQGQGAAMAIEDAAVLALTVGQRWESASATPEGVAAAHASFVAERAPRVRKVQLDSRRLGELATWRSPLARTLRDYALPLVPARLAQAQFTQLVAPGIQIAGRLDGVGAPPEPVNRGVA